MSFDVAPIPSPIRFGPGLRTRRDCHFIVERNDRGDRLDLTTCDCEVARVIDGIRYDTRAAFLVVSRSYFDGDAFFHLRQVFRGHAGRWFVLQVQWAFDSGQCNDNLIVPIQDEQVLATLRQTIRNEDCLPLLRDWYSRGWIPRNDAFVQRWAEDVLSADDCEYVIHTFATIPEGPDP